MPINRKDVEIRSQAHLMDAEGLQDTKPTESEIVNLLKNEGFEISELEIWLDDVMKLWAWNANIKEIK